MNFNNVGNILNSAYQYASRTQKTTASSTSFTESLQGAAKADTSNVDVYTEYLKSKYGNIMIQNVGSDQKSMDSLGTGTYGMNNIVIAPNVLETMANDPKKAAYYEKMIQDFFASQSTVKAQMAVGGFEIQSYGMVIHPDGTAHYYVCGDVSPEKKAKIEAQMKAEDEEKAKRRRQYLERSEEAAEKRRLLTEQYYQKQMMAEVLQKQLSDTSNLYIVNQSQVMAPAVAAYENAISTFSNSVIENI